MAVCRLTTRSEVTTMAEQTCKGWQVFRDADVSGSYWVACRQRVDGLPLIWEPFPTHAEAICYADHHARTTKNGDA